MRIACSRAENVAAAFLVAAGAAAEEAVLVARNLVQADARGIHTHGINFLPKIAARITAGVLDIPTRLTTVSDEGALCHMDGGNGFGQVAGHAAMECALEKARRYGIGMSLVRNTNHIGLLAFYSMLAAEQGMVGFAMCNSAPSMAPWGGTEPFFGTNPFSIACPSGQGHPIVLDMSTSVVARGKIRKALKNGEAIPREWAFGPDGRPTDDPGAAMKGTLMPIGGAKGYGMAFFIDLICGLLSGSKFSREITTFHKPEGPTGVGTMMLAVRIEQFMPLEAFSSLVRAHIATVRESSRAEGSERIFLPGEIEAQLQARAETEGIEIEERTIREIDHLLEEWKLTERLSGQEHHRSA